MMQTIEAVIDKKGKVHLLEPVNLTTAHRVFITILPNQPSGEDESSVDITKLGEILVDDLDTTRQEISQSLLKAIETSANELEED
jgi:hypothetical protein